MWIDPEGHRKASQGRSWSSRLNCGGRKAEGHNRCSTGADDQAHGSKSFKPEIELEIVQPRDVRIDPLQSQLVGKVFIMAAKRSVLVAL